MNVTGSNQLNLSDLIVKFGKMALSCTGCGTGTCDRTIRTDVGNTIPSQFSATGVGLEQKLGYLF